MYHLESPGVHNAILDVVVLLRLRGYIRAGVFRWP